MVCIVLELDVSYAILRYISLISPLLPASPPCPALCTAVSGCFSSLLTRVRMVGVFVHDAIGVERGDTEGVALQRHIHRVLFARPVRLRGARGTGASPVCPCRAAENGEFVVGEMTSQPRLPLPLRAVVRGAPGATCRRTGLLFAHLPILVKHAFFVEPPAGGALFR